METLKLIGKLVLAVILTFAVMCTAAEPVGWWNFAALAVVGISVWLVSLFDYEDGTTETVTRLPEAPAPTFRRHVTGHTYWVRCFIHADDPGVYVFPEPS